MIIAETIFHVKLDHPVWNFILITIDVVHEIISWLYNSQTIIDCHFISIYSGGGSGSGSPSGNKYRYLAFREEL